MTALFLTVLIASLLGSTHCAGMCGAFVAFAIGAGDPAVKQSRGFLLALYQAGRLATYALLGAVAGIVGAGIDIGGRMVGLQRVAAILAGAVMISFGIVTLLRLAGVKINAAKIPPALTQFVSAGHRRAMRYSPPVRAVSIGLLTTLLPCGWLYYFVIVAAGTGHAWSGALLMGAFWVGTLPMLTVVGIGVRALAAPLAARFSAISAIVIVLVGVYTIVARAGVSLHGTATTTNLLELVRQVKTGKQKPACCADKPDSKAPQTAPARAPAAEVQP